MLLISQITFLAFSNASTGAWSNNLVFNLSIDETSSSSFDGLISFSTIHTSCLTKNASTTVVVTLNITCAVASDELE